MLQKTRGRPWMEILAKSASLLILVTSVSFTQGLEQDCPPCSAHATCTRMRDLSMACVCNYPYQGNGSHCTDGPLLPRKGQFALMGALGSAVLLISAGLLYFAYRKTRGDRKLPPCAGTADTNQVRKANKPRRMSKLGAQKCFDAPLLRKTESDLYVTKDRLAWELPPVRRSMFVSPSLAMRLSVSGPDRQATVPPFHRFNSIASTNQIYALMEDANKDHKRYSLPRVISLPGEQKCMSGSSTPRMVSGNNVYNLRQNSSRLSVGAPEKDTCPVLDAKELEQQLTLANKKHMMIPVNGVFAPLNDGDIDSLQSVSDESIHSTGNLEQNKFSRHLQNGHSAVRQLESLEERVGGTGGANLQNESHSSSNSLDSESEHDVPGLHSSYRHRVSKKGIGPCDSNFTIAMSLAFDDDPLAKDESAPLALNNNGYTTPPNQSHDRRRRNTDHALPSSSLSSTHHDASLKSSTQAPPRKTSLNLSLGYSDYGSMRSGNQTDNSSTHLINSDGDISDASSRSLGKTMEADRQSLCSMQRASHSLSVQRARRASGDAHTRRISVDSINETRGTLRPGSLQSNSLRHSFGSVSNSVFLMEALENIGINNLEQELHNLRAMGVHTDDELATHDANKPSQMLRRRSSSSPSDPENIELQKTRSFGNIHSLRHSVKNKVMQTTRPFQKRWSKTSINVIN